MRVKVRYLGLVYQVTGVYEEIFEIDGDVKVSNLLEIILKKFNGLKDLMFLSEGVLNPFYRITVNGRDIEHLDGLETVLKDGDVVAFIGPAGG